MLARILLAAAVSSSFLQLRAQDDDGSDLTADQIITSQILGYKLQYRVFLPPGYNDLTGLPVLYVVDGQWYVSRGDVPQVMRTLILRTKMKPAIAVFLDSRNPDDLTENRRNRQFFCNPDFLGFFREEFIPAIEATYRASPRAEDRVILGLSFGGLNAACFGLHGHDLFGGVGIQSPAFHPVRYLYEAYEDSTQLPVRVFLSVGTDGDNVAQARAMRNILRKKDIPLKYIEVPEGHNWRNWRPLIDDILLFFFGT